MKKNTVLIILLFMISLAVATNISISATVIGNNGGFFPTKITDKTLHSFAGFATSLSVAAFLNSYENNYSITNTLANCSIGIFSGTFLGLAKEEIVDKNFGGDVEYAYFVYTSYGSAIGGLTFFSVSYILNILGIPSNFVTTVSSLAGISILVYLLNFEIKNGI